MRKQDQVGPTLTSKGLYEAKQIPRHPLKLSHWTPPESPEHSEADFMLLGNKLDNESLNKFKSNAFFRAKVECELRSLRKKVNDECPLERAHSPSESRYIQSSISGRAGEGKKRTSFRQYKEGKRLQLLEVIERWNKALGTNF